MGLEKKLTNAGLGIVSALALWMALEFGAQQRMIYCHKKAEEHRTTAVHYMSTDIQKWRDEKVIAESYSQKVGHYAKLLLKYGPMTNIKMAAAKAKTHNYQR